MEVIKVLFNSAVQILTIQINLFGYDISLMAVLCYSGALFLLLYFIFGLFK